MLTLKELCAKYNKNGWPDRDTVHSYIEVYEKTLAPYRHTAKNILEIGLMSGESLRMWEEYFDGNVYGMDCSETPIDGLADLRPMIAEGTHNIVIGDATSKEDIGKYFKDIKFDVVIDDGNHVVEDQLKTFGLLCGKMNEGAIYIIEDIQDIDSTANAFKNFSRVLDCEIIDRRHIKSRYDDVLIIFRDK